MSVFANLKEKVTQYIDVYFKLFKLNLIGSTADLLSYFIFIMMGLLILLCIFVFTGLGLVELFIAIGVSKMASFFITIGIYFLILFILILLRRPVTRFFASSIVQVLTEGDEADKKDDND